MEESTMTQDVRILLIGLGNLGRRFCDILAEKGPEVESDYGLRLLLVGAADSRGSAFRAEGLDPAQVSAMKQAGGTIADYPRVGSARESAMDLVARREADVLCEASPVNLNQGAEPGLTHIRTALQRGMHVATPNKGPLVVAYQELHDLARRNGVELRFDGTVAGGLPATSWSCWATVYTGIWLWSVPVRRVLWRPTPPSISMGGTRRPSW
jgi:homoserine dehydrogenase